MSQANPSSDTDSLFGLSNKWQHLAALAILFVIPLILFFDITLGGQELLRHDKTQWRASAESVIEYRETYGKEPLWASNVYSGMPSYVISLAKQVPHLDDLQSLFRGIYPAFQYWIMLGGMYFLLVLMGFRPLTALFGSIAYGLTSYFPIIIVAGHTSKFLALGFVPWVISGYYLLSRSSHKVPGLFLFSVAFALGVRAGHPQIIYYLMFLIAGLWFYDSYQYFKTKEHKPWLVLTALLITGGVIGVLGNAERFLTLQEYAQYSIRGGSAIQGTEALDPGYAFAWSQGIKETLTLLVPDLFGGASPDYWGPKSVTSGPHYLGALAIPFILIALFRVRKPLMYVFFGVGTLAVFFAWGENFKLLNNLAFDYIPFFSKFRAPETWLSLTAFCFAVVGAFGFEWMLEFAREKSAQIKKIYAPLGAMLLLLGVAFFAVNSTGYTRAGEIDRISAQIAQQNQVSPNNPQVRQRAVQIVNSQLVPSREEKAKGDLLRTFILMALAGALLYLMGTSKISAEAGSVAILLLLCIDLIQVGQRYMPEDKLVSGNVDVERYLNSQLRDIDRYIIDNIQPEGQAYPYRVLPLIDGAFSNNIPSYFYPTVGGYTGAKLSVTQDVLMADDNPLFSGDTGLNLGLLALLNTKFVTYSPGLSIPGLSPVFEGQSGVVYELSEVYPKAFFVDSVIIAEDPVSAYQLLYPGEIDFRTTAVVEGYTPATSPDTASSVAVTKYTGPEITLKTARSKPGFLVLSEIYYPPGWTATLDGTEIPIHKTNYFLRGIQVPEGEHTIELRFEPSSYSTGTTLAWISLLCQIGLGVLAGFTYFRRRSRPNS